MARVDRGSHEGSQSTRRRAYTLLSFLLLVVLTLIALGGFLQVGQHRVSSKIYRYPHKTLLLLAEAQARFKRRDLDQDGQQDFALSLQELGEAGQISSQMASGQVGGYLYRVVESEGGAKWVMSATPADVNSSTLFYYADQSQVVRAKAGSPANSQSEVYYHPYLKVVWPDAEEAMTQQSDKGLEGREQ